jgi:hypothetical protein
MTSDMIEQEISDVHYFHVPEITSHASEVVWLTFNSNAYVNWNGGSLQFPPVEPSDIGDSSAIFEKIRNDQLPPLFFEITRSLDMLVPPADVVASVLDRHLMVQHPQAPAFSIPANADPFDLVQCLVASRILARIVDRLVLPAGMEVAEFSSMIEDVGLHAVHIGGEAIHTVAAQLLVQPGFWERSEEPLSPVLGFDED